MIKVNNNYYLGIDTSAYTTSLAVIDENRNVVFDERILLEVEMGKKGLRQQEAVFQHINNLPKIFDNLYKHIDVKKIKNISASTVPRNVENSYMPVFKVSQGQAFIIAKTLNIPFKQFSHQDGHIGAGILGCGIEDIEDFLALHISGGTTELLYVKNDKNNYNIEIIGGSKDISAGQLIDRVGVKLGMNFPCGRSMDILSLKCDDLQKNMPISVKDTWVNFSGVETMFYKDIDNQKYDNEAIAKRVFYVIGESLSRMVQFSFKKYKTKKIIVIGGVASNSYLRSIFKKNITDKKIGDVYFPPKEMCTDNAIGIAYLGNIKEGF